ncbi:HesB/YadR/YfhF family protein [Neobacillus sp. YIM B06451]|uniref:HesB/YadR/YfhF family protein n=1 Tax=Neobacillus sp. YIM B06451 TaxID=3070994 RepID=UPI00292DB173|nr:HesB/YadR/YfhF family protein [Neobacillus sp. YIM B06451]
MKLNVSSKAAKWYKDEFGASDGTPIRFFVRYGGFNQLQKGFSLGVISDEPMDAAVTTESGGLLFYIEEKDLWYFDGKDVEVELDEQRQEPVFLYH